MSIAITIAWWSKIDVSALFETAEIRRGELWRLLSSTLLHVNFLHLAFNVYWLLLFGALIERKFGHAKTAILLIFFAVASSSFDFAFSQGGVGLSGVVYGLFGLLWILARRDPSFQGAVNKNTILLFLAWFVFCIVTAIENVFVVGNVAHGAGLIFGVMVGYAITTPRYRLTITATIIPLVFIGLLGATFLRPVFNASSRNGDDEVQWGYDALLANRNDAAARWLQYAVSHQPQNAVAWFNLSIAYSRLGNKDRAANALQKAHDLDPQYSLQQSNPEE